MTSTLTPSSPSSPARTATTDLDVRPISGALGAEVHGVHLADVDDATWAHLLDAWHEHLVLFFPEQHLTPEQHLALGRRFGEPEIHPYIPKLDADHPEIVVIATGGEVGGRADTWHTDVTFSPTPPMASVLQMALCPPRGGDTMWSNQYLAYESLSAPLRDLLEGLTAVHSARPFGHPEINATHPVVRVHPVTGRKALFVNRTFTSHFVELRPSESDALLAYLCSWSEQPQFQCRYRWSEGAVGIWDNRCTQHYAIADYTEPRAIHRVTVLGDEPLGGAPRWPAFASDRFSEMNGAYRQAMSDKAPMKTDVRTNSVTPVA
jgi:taurine dioxygenase